MQSTAALQAEFSISLLHLARAWRRRVDERMAEFGLSEATAGVLIQIYRTGQGLRQGAIADALGIEGPSLVRLLDQLCAAGLVCRQEDQADRRAKTVHLTQAGSTLAVRIETVLAELRPVLLDGVSAADLEACLRVLQTVGETIGWACPIPARSTEPAQ